MEDKREDDDNKKRVENARKNSYTIGDFVTVLPAAYYLPKFEPIHKFPRWEKHLNEIGETAGERKQQLEMVPDREGNFNFDPSAMG